MGEPDETFRRYLQSRVSLDEPEVVFTRLDRREARRLARKAAVQGLSVPQGRSAEARDSASGSGNGDGTASLSRAEVERLAREGTPGELSEISDLGTLRAVAERCVRCPLHEERTQVVFGEGDPEARLVCVGEAPGAREDETGRPFVGAAGELLDRLLLSVGFRREEVYICNVLKCRPPGNRDPRSEEIETCSPYLLRQVELLSPRVIVAFGAFASRTLLDAEGSLGSLRGRTHRFRGRPLVATYHPAALLRNPGWTRPAWEDLQRARRIVDGGDAAADLREGS